MDDLISRLSELRCQYNCFDENERDAYHALSEAIKALSDVPETNIGDTINRQAAIDALIDALAWTWSGKLAGKAAIDAIKNLPSVDAVEVVRCKDCSYYVDGFPYSYCDRNAVQMMREENDYCSSAERRTDE